MKGSCWSTGKDLVSSFQYRARISGDRMTILSSIWPKEAGHLSRHWKLMGFKQGYLYIKPESASAAQELQLRGGSVVRSLNKYFERPWIKGIRIATR